MGEVECDRVVDDVRLIVGNGLEGITVHDDVAYFLAEFNIAGIGSG